MGADRRILIWGFKETAFRPRCESTSRAFRALIAGYDRSAQVERDDHFTVWIMVDK